jgi:hypothetical protein
VVLPAIGLPRPLPAIAPLSCLPRSAARRRSARPEVAVTHACIQQTASARSRRPSWWCVVGLAGLVQLVAAYGLGIALFFFSL